MSYFRPFTHCVITQNTNHRNITHVYRDHSARTSIGKAEREDKESNRKWHRKEGVRSKKWYPSRKFSLYFFSVTQSILLGFSWNSNNIKVSKKKSTFKKEPTSISEITISYLHKKIIIPLLCQCGFFIHTYVSKKSIVSKDAIFYLLWYNLIRWSSHICKKPSFLIPFYSFLVKFSE